MKYYITIFFVFILNISQASIFISGQVVQFPKKTGKVFEYKDFITYEKNQIHEFQLDNLGVFNFELKVVGSQVIVLDIEDNSILIYVEEGGIYQFNYESNRLKLQAEINSNLNQHINEMHLELGHLADTYIKGKKKKKILKGLAKFDQLFQVYKDKKDCASLIISSKIIIGKIVLLSFLKEPEECEDFSKLDQYFKNVSYQPNNHILIAAIDRYILLRYARKGLAWKKILEEPFVVDLFDSNKKLENLFSSELVRLVSIRLIYQIISDKDKNKLNEQAALLVDKISSPDLQEIGYRIISKNNA